MSRQMGLAPNPWRWRPYIRLVADPVVITSFVEAKWLHLGGLREVDPILWGLSQLAVELLPVSGPME